MSSSLPASRGQKKSGISSHVIEGMEIIDNFYSRYTSLTGEENPNKKRLKDRKLTTMIKDPYAHTAEHSQLYGKSEKLRREQYSINEQDDFED